MKLVFIHGRAQEFKDAASLKAEWIAAWQAGLAKSNLPLPFGEEDIRFPYYGQTLFDLVKQVPDDQVADVVVRGAAANRAQLQFAKSIVEEMLKQTGLTEAQVAAEAEPEALKERGSPLNWKWVQAILRAIDRNVPLGSGPPIALFTNDVYQYLKNPGIAIEIENGVRNAMERGTPTVVVAHSLGTVVAYNLLRREGKAMGWNVPLLVTVGSPLAISAIRDALAPLKHPECVTQWYNAMDPHDVVALYPLNADNFGITPAIENYTGVTNNTPNRHGISGYLSDARVARRIYDAVK